MFVKQRDSSLSNTQLLLRQVCGHCGEMARERLLAFPVHWVSLCQLWGAVNPGPQTGPPDTEAVGLKLPSQVLAFFWNGSRAALLKSREGP